jgi:hypothetical protein
MVFILDSTHGAQGALSVINMYAFGKADLSPWQGHWPLLARLRMGSVEQPGL